MWAGQWIKWIRWRDKVWPSGHKKGRSNDRGSAWHVKNAGICVDEADDHDKKAITASKPLLQITQNTVEKQKNAESRRFLGLGDRKNGNLGANGRSPRQDFEETDILACASS